MAVFIIKRPSFVTSAADEASLIPERMTTALTMPFPIAPESLLIKG